jgi:hypothetical protein
LLRRLELEGEVEPQEAGAAQDQESILCHEFPVERQLHATIATRKAILPENAVNLPRVEEIDHLPKVLMVDASSVMKRVTRKLIAQIEEEIGTEAEADLALIQEVSQKEDRDLDLTPEVRKSKFTTHHHIPVADLLPAPDPDLQDQGQDPDQTQRRVKVAASIPRADLPVRNLKNTSPRVVTDL